MEVQSRWECDGNRRVGRQGEVRRPGISEARANGFRLGPRHPDGQAALLIHNLPWTVDPEWVRNSFEQFGPVVDVYLPRDFHTGNRKGFGFVKFKYMEDAGEAKESMNQAIIGGREIQITIIKDHRVSIPENYVNGERGRLESRRDSRGINQRHPHSSSTAGRLVRQVSNRSPQIAIEYGRENGVDEEGRTMVGRRQVPSIRRSAKGGLFGDVRMESWSLGGEAGCCSERKCRRESVSNA